MVHVSIWEVNRVNQSTLSHNDDMRTFRNLYKLRAFNWAFRRPVVAYLVLLPWSSGIEVVLLELEPDTSGTDVVPVR